MSTKRADGKPYDSDAFFTSRYRDDVTKEYKFDEGIMMIQFCHAEVGNISAAPLPHPVPLP